MFLIATYLLPALAATFGNSERLAQAARKLLASVKVPTGDPTSIPALPSDARAAGLLAAAGLILERRSDATATYEAGRYRNRWRTVAARVLCWFALAVLLRLSVDIDLN